MQVNLTVNIRGDFWEVVQWPWWTGWLLYTGPLYTGLTVFILYRDRPPEGCLPEWFKWLVPLLEVRDHCIPGKKKEKKVQVHVKCVSQQTDANLNYPLFYDSDHNQASQVPHQVNVYLQFLWHDVTRSISTPPWMGCKPVTGLPPSI